MSEDLLILLIVLASILLPLVVVLYFLRGFGGMFGGTFGGLATIKGGVPTEAVIQSITETGLTISSPSVGPDAPAYKLGLLVTPPGGGDPYAAETQCAIPRVFTPILVPGARIGVVVDPNDRSKVVPDWQRFNASAAGAGATEVHGMSGAQALARQGGTMSIDGVEVAFGAGGQPVSGLDSVVGAIRGGTMNTERGSAAQLLATGTHGTAVITTAQPLGKKVRDFDPKADPARLDDPMWLFTLEVSLAGQSPFPAMFGHRVPAAKVSELAPGVKLAVAVDEANPTQECAIDWDRSPIR